MKHLTILLTAMGLGFALLPQSALASTTVTYSAHCKYYNSAKQLRYSGKCEGNWGVVMHQDDDGSYQRYIMTYPNGSSIVVYIDSSGSAYVNDIPATPVKARKGYERLVTSQGEVFEFIEYSE